MIKVFDRLSINLKSILAALPDAVCPLWDKSSTHIVNHSHIKHESIISYWSSEVWVELNMSIHGYIIHHPILLYRVGWLNNQVVTVLFCAEIFIIDAMKLSTYLITLALVSFACTKKASTSEEETKMEVQEEIASKVEGLFAAIEEGSAIPSGLIQDMLPITAGDAYYFDLLSESSYLQESWTRVNGENADVYLATFSKEDGKIKAYELLGTYQSDHPQQDTFYEIKIGGSESDEQFIATNQSDPEWTAAYRISDSGEISTIGKEAPRSDFLDFIALLTAGKGVEQYQDQPFYSSFMTLIYSGR